MGVNSLSLSVGVGADVDSSPSDALSVLALRSSPRSVVLGAPPGPKGHVQSHNTPSHKSDAYVVKKVVRSSFDGFALAASRHHCKKKKKSTN